MSDDAIGGGKCSDRSNGNSGLVGFKGAFRFTKNAMISSFASGKKERCDELEVYSTGRLRTRYGHLVDLGFVCLLLRYCFVCHILPGQVGIRQNGQITLATTKSQTTKNSLRGDRPPCRSRSSMDCIEDNATTTIILPNLWCRPTI